MALLLLGALLIVDGVVAITAISDWESAPLSKTALLNLAWVLTVLSWTAFAWAALTWGGGRG